MILDIREFGEQLIDSMDLDPVYVLLWDAELPPTRLRRWLIAYWAFYDMGTASWIADPSTGKNYWKKFMEAASTKEHPRGTERRHFRGQNGIKSVQYLQAQGVDQLLDPLSQETTCAGVMRKVKEWVGFGPWIAFKVADMLERLDIAPIEFTIKDVYLFDSPYQAAIRLREMLREDVSDDDLPSWAVSYVLEGLGRMDAPPQQERVINAQEAETVLCKWGSYKTGKYKLGEDIKHCQKALERDSYVPTAKQLLLAGRKRLWTK